MKVALFIVLVAAAAVAHAGETANHADPAPLPPAKGVVEADGDRLVCERRRKLGSQRMERVCMTVAQREAAKDAARQDLQRLGRCSGNDSICAGSL